MFPAPKGGGLLLIVGRQGCSSGFLGVQIGDLVFLGVFLVKSKLIKCLVFYG